MRTHELPPAPDGTLTVVALPDMQSYACRTSTAYRQVTRWIAEHRDEQRIVFVSHLGDAVDQPGARDQWQVVRDAMRELDDVVPYGVALGNHDVMGDGRTLYDEYFPDSLFDGRPWFGGRFGHSSFQLVSAEGVDLLLLHLECNARSRILEWADRVISTHPDRHVIVSTHCWLGRLTKMLPREERWYVPRGRLPWSRFPDGNTPRQMWDRCLSRHRNIFLILSGDQAFVQARRQVTIGRRGNRVGELVSDYSYASRDLIGAHPDFFRECGLEPGEVLHEADYRSVVRARQDFGRERSGSMAAVKSRSGCAPHSPDAFIRLLRFVPRRHRVEVRTFSPITGRLCLGTPIVPEPDQHRFDIAFGGPAGGFLRFLEPDDA